MKNTNVIIKYIIRNNIECFN